LADSSNDFSRWFSGKKATASFLTDGTVLAHGATAEGVSGKSSLRQPE
jgi:hypothetical protein